MRVALVSRAFHPSLGGAERFAEILAQWLAERGHLVTVATETPADSRAHDRLRPYAVSRNPTRAQLLKTLHNSDVVHVNGLSARAAALSLAAARWPVITHIGHQAICPTGLALGVREPCSAVSTAVGPCAACPVEDRLGLRKAAVRAHRAVAAGARRNVCVSNYLANRLALPRSRVIYNPLAPSAFQRRSGTSDRLLFVGRLVDEKGVDLLLSAIAQLPDVSLELVGDGPARAKLVKLRDHLGLQRRVTFVGSREGEELRKLLANAAAVCVPSLVAEAFGYSVADAMAAAQVVVGTPVGAIPELLAEDRGYVSAQCTPEAFAASLRHALADTTEANRRATRASEFAAAELTVDHVGARYLDVYQQ